MPGTWHMAAYTRYLVHVTMHLVPGALCLVLGTWSCVPEHHKHVYTCAEHVFKWLLQMFVCHATISVCVISSLWQGCSWTVFTENNQVFICLNNSSGVSSMCPGARCPVPGIPVHIDNYLAPLVQVHGTRYHVLDIIQCIGAIRTSIQTQWHKLSTELEHQTIRTVYIISHHLLWLHLTTPCVCRAPVIARATVENLSQGLTWTVFTVHDWVHI